ncbi:MAG: carboxypeptidase regulatory-like domain-containing protein [Bryobacteraceae bacterium]|nr:carboxypeptidase regulatory-like domain-containing protein [Bryobacteraceae bacterium]
MRKFAFLAGRTTVAFAVALVPLAIAPTSGLAQEVSAGITGRITDPSGAAVVAATVTARDVNRGTAWPSQTNEEGVYAFPRVPPGTYDVTVEAAGFKTASRPGIRLELNQRARLDIALELGAVTETIEVTGAPPILNTDTTIVGTTITENQIVNTPLVTRNFIALTLLTPGVTTTNPDAFNNGLRSTGGGRPYVNGNRKEANNFLLDGIDNNHTSDNLTSYQPNLDAIQEVKMITNNASAEFGNFQGGVINVSIKSGTNQWHGTAFEFFRNDKLNANNWQRNYQGNPRTPIRWNQFGGTLGGPIKRDRLFIFGDYQGIRRNTPPAVGTIHVIPAEFRNGDFSRLLTENNIQLYDPLTRDANGIKQPFVNNQIPVARRNIVATNLFANPDLYPLPLNSGLRFNQLNAASSRTVSDQFDVKGDAKLTDKDDLSARYSWGRQLVPGANSFPLIFNSFNTAPFQNGVINWTRTIGPTMVNEFRVGANRILTWNGGEDKGMGNVAEQLGIQQGNDRGPGLMAFSFINGFATGIGNANIGTQQKFPNNTYHFANNFTLIRGRHMMKMGGQLLRQQMNPFYAGNNGRTGIIDFDGHFTGNPATASTPASNGFAEADFFLGYPSRTRRGVDTGSWGHRKNILGFYFQDDWRVSNTLTLNLGLRWEYHSPLVEVNDRQSNFEPFSGRQMLAGQDGNSRALYEPFKKDFQPRIGFAWTPEALGRRTVLRGAYTISSFMEGTGTNLRLPLNPPFNVEFESIYDSPVPGQTTEQGFTTVSALNPYVGSNIRLWDPFVRPANVQQWSFIIEQMLPSQTVFSAGYVGQKGTHLVVPMPYFQRILHPDGTTSPSPYLSGNPQLSRIAQISGTESNGNQRYDALQTQLRKRMTHGLEYQVSYTFSKGMSDAIGYYGEGGQAGSQSAYWQNLYDRRAEWGPTYFDARHIFTFVHVYDLPFGRGKTFGSAWRGITDGVLGGWQLGGILTLRSGFPLTIQARDDSGTISRGPRADRLGDGEGPKQVGPGTTWLDRSAFRQPARGTLGNSGVGVVRGPGMTQYNLSVQKLFPLTERFKMEFRTEFFNLTNTPIFGTPSRNVTAANFGEILGAQGERNVQFALKLMF